MSEQELLSIEEKLACSLISRYPYEEVKDVIDEACLHQRDKLKAMGYVKWDGEKVARWLARDYGIHKWDELLSSQKVDWLIKADQVRKILTGGE